MYLPSTDSEASTVKQTGIKDPKGAVLRICYDGRPVVLAFHWGRVLVDRMRAPKETRVKPLVIFAASTVGESRRP